MALFLRRGHGVGLLDALLDPFALLRILNVHVFNADGARICIAQTIEDFPQRHVGFPAKTACGELTIQIPHRQAVAGDIQVRMAPHTISQRVSVSSKVPARAVCVNQFRNTCRLAFFALNVVFAIRLPVIRRVGNMIGIEDAIPESVLAGQLVVHQPQELAGCRTLNNAMVIGGGQEHRLADAELSQTARGHAREFGGVVGRADTDDESLTCHQARDRCRRADRAGIRQGHGAALEIIRGQFTIASTTHRVVIGGNELEKCQCVRFLQDRHHQRALPVGLRHVDRQPETDVRETLNLRPALLVGGVAHVH